MSIHRLFQCGLKSPKYSNHRQKAIPYIAVFQSLRSLRTATPSRLAEARAAAGISILAVLADRDVYLKREGCPYSISILAVLADRDARRGSRRRGWRNFNPRGPCGPRLFPFFFGISR